MRHIPPAVSSKDPYRMPSFRPGCSPIGFRHQPWPEAPRAVRAIGLGEFEPGTPSGMCGLVPSVLDVSAGDRAAGQYLSSLL